MSACAPVRISASFTSSSPVGVNVSVLDVDGDEDVDDIVSGLPPGGSGSSVGWIRSGLERDLVGTGRVVGSENANDLPIGRS
jgi:hypothetical protein